MTEIQRRPVPRIDENELTVAMAFLDFARHSVLKKADGLRDADLRRPAVPTGTSILRLIRHLTDGERFWFIVQLLGQGTEPNWSEAEDDVRPSGQIISDYRAAIKTSNHAILEVGHPAKLSARETDGRRQSLRWTLAHMTSETARHAGHADIARELLDGVTGR